VNVKQLFNLAGRVAIVSGGSMGLGLQMAEGLAEMGANLAICARNKERSQASRGSVAQARRADAGLGMRRQRQGGH
jgi:NAD(P)-dependent dehydrogenase (short-subunit alcohol dehydrogenase family)